VGADGLVEFKCPNTATHIDTLLGEPFAGKYIIQAQWQMACAERQWCDLCSYDPRLPESMRLFVQRVKRDDETIKALTAEVVSFLVQVNEKVHALRERFERKAAA
jgi:YqaJ-like recombinase protein